MSAVTTTTLPAVAAVTTMSGSAIGPAITSITAKPADTAASGTTDTAVAADPTVPAITVPATATATGQGNCTGITGYLSRHRDTGTAISG
jgi:hypothetical protein